MSNQEFYDILYSNFLLMYKGYLAAQSGPADALEVRRRAFFDSAVRVAEEAMRIQQNTDDNAAITPKAGRTVTAIRT